MIVEQRTYLYHPGAIPAFAKLYQENGMAVQKRVLGNMIGYFQTEIGPLNQTVHLWGYESLDDRSRRRAELAADNGWRDFLAEAAPLIISQESKILVPMPFSPIGGTG